jgi:hypothetical protein
MEVGYEELKGDENGEEYPDSFCGRIPGKKSLYLLCLAGKKRGL